MFVDSLLENLESTSDPYLRVTAAPAARTNKPTTRTGMSHFFEDEPAGVVVAGGGMEKPCCIGGG